MSRIMQTNPARLIAAIVAVLAVGAAFGLSISDHQVAAITAAVGAILVLVQGEGTRAKVFSPDGAQSYAENAVTDLIDVGPYEIDSYAPKHDA